MDSLNSTVATIIEIITTNCTDQHRTNTSENCTQDHPISVETYKVYTIINGLIYTLVMIFGLTGNALVLYVIVRYSKMQTLANLYIFNLAVADEIFLISIPFILTTMIIGHWPFGMIMCKIYWTTTSINQFTSSLFLTVMSVDRYLAVCHPISSNRWRTPLIAKIVSVSAWTASSLMVVPLFMYAAEYEGQCNIFWPETVAGVKGEKAFTVYTFIMSFAVPIVVILVLYTLVVRRVRATGPRQKSKQRRRNQRKVTRLVFAVVIVYFCCYLPFWVTQLSLMLSSSSSINHSPVMVCVFLLAYSLTYCNSAVNPVLYAFLSENFKKSFVKACQCAQALEVNNILQPENSMHPRKRDCLTAAGILAVATTPPPDPPVRQLAEMQSVVKFSTTVTLNHDKLHTQAADDVDVTTSFTELPLTSRTGASPYHEEDDDVSEQL